MSITDRDRLWIGPSDPEKHTVYRMSSATTEEKWLETSDGTQLDPDFSEFSVRIFDPHFLTLNFIHKTIAVLPKSRLRSIYNLIGEYLANSKT